jgi:hypothetical protein
MTAPTENARVLCNHHAGLLREACPRRDKRVGRPQRRGVPPKTWFVLGVTWLLQVVRVDLVRSSDSVAERGCRHVAAAAVWIAGSGRIALGREAMHCGSQCSRKRRGWPSRTHGCPWAPHRDSYHSVPPRTARRQRVSRYKAREWHMCAIASGPRRSSPDAFAQVDPPVCTGGSTYSLVPPREFET